MNPDLICVVAIDFDPLTWAVECEICDDVVSEETTDEAQADLFEYEHRKVHDHWEGWEGSAGNKE